MKRNPSPRVLLPALFAALSLPAAVDGTTLDPAVFSKEVSFTASGYDGASTLEHFPALVRLSEGTAGFRHADIGATTNAAYAALRFADAVGNNLDYEIETWDPAGTSFVWVSLPSLSGTDTRFFAFYKPAAGATLPEVHPTNVWTSAGYVGVWHMSDIVKTYTNGYKEYDAHLWGHVFPDSTGSGADATKGTTSWNTSLLNAPNQASGAQAFPESNGRANGTLGAHGYTPSTVPPTANGGGAGDWNFSTTGYSTEAWIYPNGGRSILASSQNVGSNGTGATNFIHVATAGARIAGNGWGGSTMSWDSCSTTETDSWHFVTTVWTPAGSPDKSVLYGSNGDAAPRAMDSKDYHATDQFMTDGMGLTTGSGGTFGVDEMRVRRGLSTADWIQANWDTQRVGTDFLTVGAVRDPHEPVVSDITQTGASATIGYSFAGVGDSAKALFVNFATKVTNEVAVANLANPSATATGLAADTDYDVRFVVLSGNSVVRETPAASFTTTGRPVLDPHEYHYSVTFTASGYDGAETLEHFPVLVHLSEATVPGFSYAGVDPADIRFTAADGSLLAHEVETWDTNGLSAVWVGLPSLSGTDTAFTMHWKPFSRPGVAAQPAYRVWKYADYLGVWHMNDTVQGVFGRQFDDSSGHGMITTNYYANNNIRPPLVVTNAIESANGTAWFRNRNSYWGDERGDYLKYGVTPEQTADWNFSETGYSVETWARPAFVNANDHGGMFCTSLNPDNNNNWNALNALCVRNDRAGFECGWKTYYANNAWTGDETNAWHYVAGVWAAAGSGDASICYEARANLPAGELRTLVSRTDVAACDFVGRNMGLIGGNPPPRASGYQSYQVDEMRVRRGRSTEAWIQANWDTQRVGTDFLTAGEITNRQEPTIVLIR